MRNYYNEAKNNLLKQAPNLKGIIFGVKDYKNIDISKIQNSVIYLDPPYKGVKEYSNSKDFDYEYFWEFCRKLSINNYVFISEENAPKDFITIYENNNIKRTMNPNRKNNLIKTEKIFTYNKGRFQL